MNVWNGWDNKLMNQLILGYKNASPHKGSRPVTISETIRRNKTLKDR
jgi:hypothetical protein